MRPTMRVGNVTSKCNGVTRYRFCLAVRAITFRSDNGSNVTRVITISSDNGFIMPRAITLRTNSVSPQHKVLCDNCSVSRWRPHKVDKRMVLEYTHGLFIT